MTLRPLHIWLLDRPSIQRMLLRAPLDQAALLPLLTRYMRVSAILRCGLAISPLILTALTLPLAGSAWPALLVVWLAWALTWRRWMGCQVMSTELAWEMLKPYLDPRVAPDPAFVRLLKVRIKTVDDCRLARELLDPGRRCARQAAVLHVHTEAAPAEAPPRPRL